MPQEELNGAQVDQNGRRQLSISEDIAEMLEQFRPELERQVGVTLSRNKVAEWCIRRAIEANRR